MPNTDKYWDLDLFEVPAAPKYEPLTEDDWRYIVKGIGQMIQDVFDIQKEIRNQSFKYRILERLCLLVSEREWHSRKDVDNASVTLHRDLEYYRALDQKQQRAQYELEKMRKEN